MNGNAGFFIEKGRGEYMEEKEHYGNSKRDGTKKTFSLRRKDEDERREGKARMKRRTK